MNDFGKIKVGQKVNIKLENYPDTEFGVINGTVKSMSVIPDKEGLYFIDVNLCFDKLKPSSDKRITSYDKEIEFKQVMRGSSEIITEGSRLIECFFDQFREIINRD